MATQESDLFEECLRLVVDKCTSLKALSVDSLAEIRWNFERPGSIQNLVYALIDQNPGIQKLSTNKVYCLQKAFVLSGLRSLSISEGLSTQDVACLLTTFPLLEELVLREAFSGSSKLVDNEQQHPITDDSTVKQKPSALKHLSVRGMNTLDELTTILERCPKLQSIYSQFTLDRHDKATKILPPDFLSDVSLIFRDSDSESIQQVLKVFAYQQILTLALDITSADIFHCIAQNHSRRLQRLVVSCHNVPETLLIILAECVGLKTLRAVNGRVESVASIPPLDFSIKTPRISSNPLDPRALITRPWVCVDLEILEMPLALNRRSSVIVPDQMVVSKMTTMATTSDGSDVGSSCTKPGVSEWQKAERLFMRQLAALTQLRRLILPNGSWSGLKTDTDMSWRIPTGLEQLKTLKRLEVLDVSGRQYVQGIPEFRWMKANWTSLNKLVVCRMESERKCEWFRTCWPELNVVNMVE
ncbi:hypothetical protein DFQ27_001792 [Actinomortierella ambigua]|uniref:Uncharacterized protein n=1 Tax=Actinomortierella ambigua TaxID=1343610 RepID=A0A9P6QCS9_9FUNG|nr:hypothetical protein DFQ27_001792 [Actinomortierella ambigua]